VWPNYSFQQTALRAASEAEHLGDAVKDRWAIYIDVEGFSALYDRETAVLDALGDLMEGIYDIGTNCYPESPDRLFAHQTGDGFVVVSEFGRPSLEIPVAISIALLRHVAAGGRFAKASIGEGDFADVWGCYPRRIREACSPDDSVPLGGGLMTIFPVMGTALIDAFGVAKRSPSGSLLTAAGNNRSRLPSECIVRDIGDRGVVSVDWVHSTVPLVTNLQDRAGLRSPSSAEIEAAFRRYCTQERPPDRWIDITAALLALARSP
jgi:hypothetical protein